MIARLEETLWHPPRQRQEQIPPDAIFAVELDGLPEFWDEGLSLEVQQQRIDEVMKRQREFVHALGFLEEQASFELRLISNPSADLSQRLRFIYLVSIEEQADVATIWHLFHSSFPGDLDVRLRLLSADETKRICQDARWKRYYEWRPIPTELSLPAQLRSDKKRIAIPPSPRTDNRLALIRALLKYPKPIAISFCVTPLRQNHPDKDEAVNLWTDILRTIDAISSLSLTTGGLEELRRRFGDIGILDFALDQTLGKDQIRYFLQEIIEQQQRDLFTATPRSFLDMIASVAQRIVQSSSHFRWRVYAAVPEAIQTETFIERVVANELGRDETGKLLTLYRWGECGNAGEAQDNFRMVRANSTDSFEADLTGGAIIDEIGALALLQFPILPQGGIPGIRSYQANPFSGWQLEERTGGTEIVFGDYIDSRINMFNEAHPGAGISLDDLTRHALITGSTGSGKSTTSRRLITEIHRHGIPFLIIEPVKPEYSDLAFTNEFLEANPDSYPRLFQPGSIDAPLWFNPFYVRKGVTLNTHISYLLSCFMAAFPMPGVYSIVFARIMREAYRKKGEELLKRYQVSPFADPNQPLGVELSDDDAPDLELISETAEAVIKDLNYKGEFNANLQAAIALRLRTLQQGVIGSALKKPSNGDLSFERRVGTLLKQPALIQLHHIADKNEKALIMAFLLTSLYEYYEQQPARDSLGHITLIEEAHVLLENVSRVQSEESSNTRGKAIELFADMLAEIRSRGEGLIIVEQLPSKLIPEAIKNTNLKIMHRLTAREDRDILGASMNFNERQSRFATTLQRGQAIVFREGLNQPALIRVRPATSRAEIRARVDAILARTNRDKTGKRIWPNPLDLIRNPDRSDASYLQKLILSVGNYLHSMDNAIDSKDRQAICWYLHQLTRPWPKYYELIAKITKDILTEEYSIAQ